MHKHSYPRSLNLKAVLPESQTVAIASAAGRQCYLPPLHGMAKHLTPPTRTRSRRAVVKSKIRISPPPLVRDQDRERAEPHRADRTVGPLPVRQPRSSAAVLSVSAHTAGMDVEYHVAAPATVACVIAQVRARHGRMRG